MTSRIIYLFLIITFLSVCLACQGSWQCGNNLPYQTCLVNTTIGVGLAIDTQNNRIMFTANYAGDYFKRLLSIPINGGNIKYEYSIFSDQFYSRTLSLYKWLSQSKQLFITRSEYKMGSRNAYSPQLGSVTWRYSFYVLGDFIFNEDTHSTIYCDYLSIKFINFIPLSNSQNIYDNASTLYSLPNSNYEKSAMCNGIGINGNDLYIQSSNKIFRGTTTCLNCTSDNLQLLFQLNVNEYISKFEVTNTHFYFITTSGLFRIPLTGDASQRQVLVESNSQNNPVEMEVYGNYVYFISNNKIQRISLSDPSNIITLYDGTKIDGDCSCSEGFSGETCNVCDPNTHITSWVNGKPMCIPLGENKLPVNCNENYQCGNFAYCSGFSDAVKVCQCYGYFKGDRCEQCDGTITWNSDKPTCNPANN